MIDRLHQRLILDIPKNASSFILDWTTRTDQWHVHTLLDTRNHHSLQEIIVVLRDPVERWLSGFAQYACSWVLNASRFFNTDTGPGETFQRKSGREFVERYDWVTERLIFDNLETFDDHVWPQTWFFNDLLPRVPRRYFMLDHDFNKQFALHLNLPPPAEDLDRNIGDSNADAREIRQFLLARIHAVPELLAAIRQAYRQDYEIIDCLRCP